MRHGNHTWASAIEVASVTFGNPGGRVAQVRGLSRGAADGDIPHDSSGNAVHLLEGDSWVHGRR
jgi:hypothetical protein